MTGTPQAPLLPPFDFSDALRLSTEARIQQCIATLQQFHKERDFPELFERSLLSMLGVSPEEITILEQTLGVALPDDYRYLLSVCRYVEIAPGCSIYGIDNGNGDLFMLDDLAIPGTFIVLGDYFRFADGDQLMLALHNPDQPVVAYFHEHEPRIEYFAPTISLALWRLTYEEM